jgi:hypothetical protein
MTAAAFAATRPSMPLAGNETPSGYRPGVCNIGPEEVQRRRRAGHVGLIATIGLFAVLVAIEAPPIARAVVGLPAAAAASGYLQAWFRFCAGFASRGLFNFGAVGETHEVVEVAARAQDRAKGRQIALLSLAVGVAVAVVAVAVPL